MNSFLKGVLHTVVTVLALYVPTLVVHSGWADVTIGSVIGLALNWLTSHSIPTTTGASAKQA